MWALLRQVPLPQWLVGKLEGHGTRHGWLSGAERASVRALASGGGCWPICAHCLLKTYGMQCMTGRDANQGGGGLSLKALTSVGVGESEPRGALS